MRKPAGGGATTRSPTAGRQRLAEWLSEPVSSPTEYRDLGLLKFFFAELAQPGDVIALAHEQARRPASPAGRLRGDRRALRQPPDRPELASRVRSAELGVRLARTAAEFWEEILEHETQVDAA